MKKLLKEMFEEHKDDIKNGIALVVGLTFCYLVGSLIMWLFS
jgi:hypothetical protein